MKSPTDMHWNKRATGIKEDAEVNISDVFQRNLELSKVCPFIDKEAEVLEVGCGNGYSTSVFRKFARWVDAFDYSEDMIARAKRVYGETSNSFFVDNVLNIKHIKKQYDIVLCIRVLINLRNLEEQKLALKNLAPLLREGGKFILVEGFKDGFLKLNEIRMKVGLPAIEPAKINFYSTVDELMPQILSDFLVEKEIYLGSYDYLTRFVYPYLVGNENVQHNTVFHEKAQLLAGAYNPFFFNDLSRVRGFILRKK